MDRSKLVELNEAKNIVEDTLKDFQWKVKELPLNQCLGMYLAEDYVYDEKTIAIENVCLDKGHRLCPMDVGALATLGEIIVSVYEKPMVSIISIGDELVSLIEEAIEGKVRDSNSFALAALIQGTGCDLGGVYLLRDDKKLLKETLQEALDKSDLLIISGGVSRGGKGLTAEAINELGRPGVIVDGLKLNGAEATVLGIIEDTHCSCCNRKSLIAGLPGETAGLFLAYDSLIDGLIKKIFFKAI